MAQRVFHGVRFRAGNSLDWTLYLGAAVTPSALRAFEVDVAARFNAGEIRAPVHLSGGNEEQLCAYFAENYRAERGDWVLSTWRSHYHALLCGIDPAQVYGEIMAGRSISLCFPEHRFLSSAIVGGTLPIATGIALGLRKSGSPARVHCFIGDMAARTGAFSEALQYAEGHDLPIRFIVEDNGKSVLTDTEEVWGGVNPPYDDSESPLVTYYNYVLPWPHSGAGVRVEF